MLSCLPSAYVARPFPFNLSALFLIVPTLCSAMTIAVSAGVNPLVIAAGGLDAAKIAAFTHIFNRTNGMYAEDILVSQKIKIRQSLQD